MNDHNHNDHNHLRPRLLKFPPPRLFRESLAVLLTDAEFRLLCLMSRGGRRACEVRPARALHRLAELDLVEINRDSDTAEVTEAGWDWLAGE